MLEKAQALQQQGQFAEAEQIYLQLLRQEPLNSRAWHQLGVMTMEAGWPERALTLLERARLLEPHNPTIHHSIGRGLHMQGRLADALQSYDRALAAAPELAVAHGDRAIALRESGALEHALVAADRALALDPANFEAHNTRGMILAALARNDDALENFRQAVTLRPDFVEAHNNLGLALLALERPEQALESLDRAIALAPDFAIAHSSRASALAHLNRYAQALESFERALTLEPDNRDFLYGHANALLHLHRYEESLAQFDAAIARKPDFYDARINRGLVLGRMGQLEDSLAAFDSVIADAPNAMPAHTNRGRTFQEMGQPDDAAAAYAQGTARDPGFAQEAAFYIGMLRLQQGDLAEGWRLYDNRAAEYAPRPYQQPQWCGEDLTGKTLYVYAEQGLGDTIMFARYLTLAKAKGARVIFSPQDPLAALMRELDPDITILPWHTPPQAFDFHQRLMSLPLIFATELKAVPAAVPYLHAQPARVARWRERLGGNGYKIGICWSSSGTMNYGPERSFPVGILAPLAQRVGVRLISLQKDPGVARFAQVPDGMRIESLGEDFDAGPDAFLDTAAVMASLDLVVTCDTAIAHLAGAMGRPVWTALKHVPEWRWLLERDDSPWYPTMTLFRQPRLGDWQSVAQAMADTLAADRKA